jgi:adenylate cyclase
LKVLEASEIKAGEVNKGDLQRSMQLCEEAIALDPEYAHAYATLSTAHSRMVMIGASDSPRESLRRAVEIGKKAIALDESRSGILVWPYALNREFDKAIEAAEKAVSHSPNSAAGYLGLGAALVFAGRHQEAIPVLQKCLRLSPVPYHIGVFGWLAASYTALGQYEEAVVTLKKSLQIYGPDSLRAHVELAANYIYLGRDNEARAEAAEVLRINPRFSMEQHIKNFPVTPAYKDRWTKALLRAGLK